LAKNHLSDQIAEPLALFIKQARSLEVLILHWNRLGSTTGVAIAKSLLIQSYLKVLDLSYNVIGSASNELCTQTWCKLLSSPQTELVHLDLSYNSLKLDELTKLSAALESNQRLIGLHVDGNSPFASMDAAGFLQIDQIPKQQGSS
jgi:Ran GTPase-activating protein (RanGAP) involved in mRNA processing and transport